MMNKKLVLIADIIVLAAILIAGILYFKNKNSDEPATTLVKPGKTTVGEASTMPLGIEMTAVDYKDGILTLEINNFSGYEMGYGMDYTLWKFDGTEWIECEPKEDFCWIEIWCVLPDLTTETVTCDLTYYGDLYAGKYKLVKSGMEAEFELK